MKDVIVVALLLSSFATLLCTHLAIAVRLTRRAGQRYRGLLALLVPPLAPLWAQQARWTTMVRLWVGAVCVYAASLVVARW